MLALFIVVIVVVGCFGKFESEGECSRFGFEMKMMERLVIMEQKNAEIEQLKEKQQVLENQNTELVETLESQRKESEERDKLQNERLTKQKQVTDELERQVVEQQNKNKLQDQQIQNTSIEGSTSVITLAQIPAKNFQLKTGVVGFNTVVYNDGNAYNANTGIFTAPVEGNYIFFTKMCTRKNDGVIFEIMRGQKSLSKTAFKDREFNNCGSDVVATHLHSGDNIWVTISEPSYTTSSGAGISSFTAVLLNTYRM